MKTMKAMFGLISRLHRQIWWTIGLNTLLGLGAIAPPYLMKVVLNDLIEAARSAGLHLANGRTIVIALGAMLLLRVVLTFASYLQERLSDVLRLEAILELRRKMFEHVLGLSVDYYETTRSGEIVERITQGVYEFGIWLQDVSQAVLLRIITIILSLAVMTWVSPWAGLVAAVTVVAKLALALRKKQVSRPHRVEARLIVGRISGQVTETVQNLTTLRAFGGEAGSLAAHEDLAQEARTVRLRQHQIEWRYNAGVELIEGVGTVATLAVVAWGALQGRVTPGDIVLVALYLQQITSNLRPMATFIDGTGELISTCEHMLELLAVEPTVKDSPDAQALKHLERLEFRNVSFSYPGHEEVVLKNISFVVEAGNMVALVGPSGTGKTTIVKLLLRLYDPTDGEILVNDKPMRAYTGASVRAHMGTVMQDVALFNDTLTDNVLMANPDATRAEVLRAMELSHADEFASRLPDGYDTMVGERGIKLSGGQKQRIAIARAILKQPDLVMLDEATSALDSASERQVQAGLTQLMRGRMAVVIAHRLSTVAAADSILVIKQGRVVEQGKHAELVEVGGLYAKLFKLQSS